MTKRPFKIKFLDTSEVRMGSPYNNCHIELIGTDIKLPKVGWQDKFAWTSDSKKLVLVKWNFDKNEPSFHFFIIDTQTGKSFESKRIFGLLDNLSIGNNIIKYRKFLYDKIKSIPGKELCCHFEEEYEFPL
jgi:hypothetical protein